MTELAQMFELQQSATFFGSWGPLRRQKYLRLILQSPEGLRMQDPVTVTLIDRTDITLLLLPKPPFRIAAVCRIGT